MRDSSISESDVSLENEVLEVEPDELLDSTADEAMVDLTGLLEEDGHDVVPEEDATEEELTEEEPEDSIEADPESEEDEGGEEEPQEEEPQGSRAQKRIQGLVSEKKALEERMGQMEQYYNQQFQQAQQQQAQLYQQQLEQLQRQNELQEQQLQMQQRNRQADEEANMSVVDKLKLDAERGAEERARQALLPEIEALKQQLTSMEQQRQQQQKVFEQQQRLQYFTDEVAKVRQESLFEDLSEEAVAGFSPEQLYGFDQAAMSYIAGTGSDTQTAVADLKEAFEAYHQARLHSTGVKKVAKKVSKKVVKPTVKKTPAKVPEDNVSTQMTKRPTDAEIVAAGYDSRFEWALKGKKPVPKL